MELSDASNEIEITDDPAAGSGVGDDAAIDAEAAAAAGEAASAASSGGAGALVDTIFGAIDGAIDGWYEREGERRAAIAADPCRASVEIGEFVATTLRPARARLAGAVAALEVKVEQQLARARAGQSVQGVPTWEEYLLDEVLPASSSTAAALWLFGPIGGLAARAAWLAWVRDRTTATARPSASTYYGVSLPGVNGVYLYAAGVPNSQPNRHKAQGALRGPAVAAAYDAWIELIEVAAGGVSRQRLAAGAERLATADAGIADALGQMAEADAACAGARDRGEDRADEAQRSPWVLAALAIAAALLLRRK